jgi:putative oxidoreductase
MSFATHYYLWALNLLDRFAPILPPLLLRLVLAWEFGEAGYEKLSGNLLPSEVSWQMATWFELGGTIALILGFATRFFSLSLIILTIVAIASVHWPEHWSTLSELSRGYRIIDEEGDGFGNYKLPLIYLIMLLPLLFGGAGKLSFDHWIRQKYGK